MSVENIIQKNEEERKNKTGLSLDKQIEILREYIENPNRREEIKKKEEFKIAYSIFLSLPTNVYRKIFYGEEGKDIVEEFPKLVGELFK